MAMVSDVREDLRRRLQDLEFRREYGAARAQSALALLLFEARKAKGLSQEDLAHMTGVSQAYIAKLEGGDANPTIRHFGAMLAVLWLEPEFILEPLGGSEYRSLSAPVQLDTAPSVELVGRRSTKRIAESPPRSSYRTTRRVHVRTTAPPR